MNCLGKYKQTSCFSFVYKPLTYRVDIVIRSCIPFTDFKCIGQESDFKDFKSCYCQFAKFIKVFFSYVLFMKGGLFGGMLTNTYHMLNFFAYAIFRATFLM